MTTPAWYTHALCRGTDLNRWYPETSGRVPAELVALCAACPVNSPCYSAAMADNEQGIWAGTTARQRRADRRVWRIRRCLWCDSVYRADSTNRYYCGPDCRAAGRAAARARDHEHRQTR